MGAVWSYAGRYSVLPLPGSGNYRTGCADLMITDTKDGDTGVFMRVFYPVDRNDFGRASTVSEHPHWLSRPEYVNGLATYMKQSAGRLQFIFNWLIGETSDYSACWTYKLYPDPISGRNKERQFQIRLVDKDDKRMFKIRNQQLNKRVSECVKALHVLEEINLGQLQFDNVAVGKDMDWSQFKGRLDLSRAFVAGHSFGGATAVAATAFSTDFQAAVVMDGWLYPLESGHYERASQPTLFLNAGKWQYAENLERMAKLRNVAEKPMFTLRYA
ncbi:Platelet-activating factor acetylhydrolase, plasma/intracellular isoform II [Ancylostoma ceylanicum]|uniref:1-alkyl-2-acetylglycerophosphocholine esterase n=1 Tax=Ancylostoma ceylanicum TaxID=53326 RepID=A0A0D6MCS3_9BILA|nr:Platelet-activating factor acetylhydrolase, plasma/intracellular isoform II [Ancylostoma ceylanicum]